MAKITIKLIVLGNPVAQKRHRSFQRGKFRGQYDPSAKNKSDLLRIVQQQAPPKPLDCPLRVDVHLYFSRPKNHFRTGQFAGALKINAPLWHIKRPDRDNCDKMILDALSGVFWRDDSLICAGEIIKQYNERPRTEILIETLE